MTCSLSTSRAPCPSARLNRLTIWAGNPNTELHGPTTGLHFADIELLLKVLHPLRDAGNTIVVIEHNLDVVKTAEWVIDMGTEGGAGGGEVMGEGTPEDITGTRRVTPGRI